MTAVVTAAAVMPVAVVVVEVVVVTVTAVVTAAASEVAAAVTHLFPDPPRERTKTHTGLGRRLHRLAHTCRWVRCTRAPRRGS